MFRSLMNSDSFQRSKIEWNKIRFKTRQRLKLANYIPKLERYDD